MNRQTITICSRILLATVAFRFSVTSEASHSANDATSEGRMYSAILSPDNQDVCAVDSPPSASVEQLSLGRCTSACNRLPGCNWFTFVNKTNCHDNLDNCGNCALFSFPPSSMDIVPGCSLYVVGSIYDCSFLVYIRFNVDILFYAGFL